MNQAPPISRLKALADPTRLRILGLLPEAELTVGELTAVLGMTQSRVSGHLGVLRDAGLVRGRRQGTSTYYSLAGEGEALATWNAVEATLPPMPEAKHDDRRLAEVLAARRERGREFFDRAAAGWDDERSESLGRFAGRLALGGLLPRNLTVLDLGTGTGGLLPLLGRRVDRVVAVDMSMGMLRRARARWTDGEVPVALVRGDAESLPLPEGTVDGVVANMILHHLSRPETVLREIARVLRPEGRAVIVDFAAHEETWLLQEEGHRWAGFAEAQLAGWCVDSGLGMPEFHRVPTPDSGRWSRLSVFVAEIGKAARSGAPASGR